MRAGPSAILSAALLLCLTAPAAAKGEVSRDTSPGSIAGPEGVAQEVEKIGKRESMRPIVSPLQPSSVFIYPVILQMYSYFCEDKIDFTRSAASRAISSTPRSSNIRIPLL